MSRLRQKNVPTPQVLYLGQGSQRMLSYGVWQPWSNIQNCIRLPWTTLNRKWSSIEICSDELHLGPPYKTGGPLDIQRITDPGISVFCNGDHRYVKVVTGLPTWEYRYNGGFLCNWAPIVGLDLAKDPNHSSWALNGLSDVSSYGPKGWKMYQPAKPVVDIGQSAFEFRELPRMLKTTAKGFHELWRSLGGHPTQFKPKSVADQWLNLQFGWSPFIGDLGKLLSYQKKLANKYKYLKNSNGQWRKRGGAITETLDSSCIYSSNVSCLDADAYSSAFIVDPLRLRTYTKVYEDTQKKVWFEGRFKYYIPDLEEFDTWKNRHLEHLGLEISPSLVYNLTPWTWLLDWFSNIGDVIDNVSSASNQVTASYAYVMGHTIKRRRVETQLPFGTETLNLSLTYEYERKQRVQANPFGFGLNWDQLNPVQWSILGALGISRMH